MRFALICIVSSFLLANTHYAKLEPFSKATIKAQVAGQVTMAKEALEGRVVDGKIVQIDDTIEQIELKSAKKELNLTKKELALNKKLLPFLKKSLAQKEQLYKKITPLSATSFSQKDSVYSAFLSAKTQFFATKEKILSLQEKMNNLQKQIALLQDKIEKKAIKIQNRYLYKLFVREGDFVSIGSPIATILDTSKAKLTIFLTKEELKNITKKKIYINGRVTNLRFYKIWQVADSKYISSYRAEIVTKPFTQFSTLIKVEVK